MDLCQGDPWMSVADLDWSPSEPFVLERDMLHLQARPGDPGLPPANPVFPDNMKCLDGFGSHQEAFLPNCPHNQRDARYSK